MNQVGFVLGDMANPEGDLPVVITSAMMIVISGFFLMNAAIYVVLPFETIRTSTTVAVVRAHPHNIPIPSPCSLSPSTAAALQVFIMIIHYSIQNSMPPSLELTRVCAGICAPDNRIGIWHRL